MPRFFVSRLLECFFRRWWLYLLPIVLFVVLGVATVLQGSTSYRSSGVVRVSGDTLLSELTSVRGGSSFGYDTPAAYTSREINTLLGTELFTQSVIEQSGLSTAVERGLLPVDALAIWTAPSGDLLVRVNAASEDPEVAYRLATATIDSYLQWQVDDNVTDSRSAEEFFESQLVPFETRLDEARAELSEYLVDHPAAFGDESRPADEQIQIASLTADLSRADEQLSTATQSLAEARLATAQTTTDIAQRLRIVDEPRLPGAPEPHLKQDAITMLMFGILGCLVGAAALVVATLLDRSVRYSEEIETHLEVPVLASVPNSRSATGTPVY